MQISNIIARELGVRQQQVEATVALLNEGATVPFIARYRKEVTGGLDDTQLRTLHERLGYLRELQERRDAILKSIEEQGKLNDDLRKQIEAADTKQRLEDLYLPYKPKRRTKGQIAIEAGIEPLADALLNNPQLDPETQAQGYINADAGFADTKAVLEGARYILMERFAEIPDLVGQLRNYMWHNGYLRTRVIEDKKEQGAKFADYFDFSEPLKRMPSHRVLAMLRGQNEDVLRLDVVADRANLEDAKATSMETKIAHHVGIEDRGRKADDWLSKVVRWTWKVKLHTQLSTDLLSQVRERAEEEAIRVFARNLKDLLMAAPAGRHITLGLDPGLRTGVKVVVVDDTGKLLNQATIYPHAPQNRWDASLETLAALCHKHKVSLIAIGNGTASRETDKLAGDLITRHSELNLRKIMVSEAGASVYSASQLAADEFPDLDVSLRGAVSIARRLQDPLAELVKIDPKSIGVGQYQHDVNQTRLAHMLDAVVEDCVNAVGVDLNTASEPLLTRVSGLSTGLAQNIVAFRNEHGRFQDRAQILKVKRLGPKAFEQCAGFLRIRDGKNPLDASAVHPEAYPVVERILSVADQSLTNLMGNRELIHSLKPQTFTTEQFGLPTITDILKELEKPGRDPRGEFKTATFAEGVETIGDLASGMTLEGVVTNVTNFGAFVDVGVHQDGLVHISQLSNSFVSDPHQVVKAGDIVEVRVLDVDVKRKRISLSMKSEDRPQHPKKQDRPQPRKQQVAPQTALAMAFSKNKNRR